MTDGSKASRTGRSRKQSVKSVLCQVSKFLDGFELGSAYFVNFEELRLKMAILKMKMALLSLKKLKMALCAGTPMRLCQARLDIRTSMDISKGIITCKMAISY